MFSSAIAWSYSVFPVATSKWPNDLRWCTMDCLKKDQFIMEHWSSLVKESTLLYHIFNIFPMYISTEVNKCIHWCYHFADDWYLIDLYVVYEIEACIYLKPFVWLNLLNWFLNILIFSVWTCLYHIFSIIDFTRILLWSPANQLER